MVVHLHPNKEPNRFQFTNEFDFGDDLESKNNTINPTPLDYRSNFFLKLKFITLGRCSRKYTTPSSPLSQAKPMRTATSAPKCFDHSFFHSQNRLPATMVTDRIMQTRMILPLLAQLALAGINAL